MSTAELFPAAEFTGVTVDDRAKWLAMRRTMVTASKTAALFGEHPFATALDLYAEMVTERPAEELVNIDSPMFWGSALEQAILESAARYYGWEYVKGGQLLRSRKYPHLGATLDGAVDVRASAGWHVYEGKTTSAWRAKDWNEETSLCPTHVILQAQHQLLVTGGERAIVFCLIGGQRPVRINIEANAEFHAAIVEESERFMEMVRKLEPPRPSGRAGDTKALQRLYPRENGATVALPAEALEWTRQYQEAGAKRAELERRQKHFKQLIMHAMGSASYGVLPEPVGGKSVWRWATEAREGYEVEARESRKLLPLKGHPAGVVKASALPPANTNTLVDLLAESVEREALPKIRYGQGRRRSKR